jgi:hypothetical protein
MLTEKCEFSLDEVFCGKAKVLRRNGEGPEQYRVRLQKRLSSLMVLLAQLQSEVDIKSVAVKDARDEVHISYLLALSHIKF